MAEKTKINDHGDVIFSEEDAIELLYSDPNFDITKLYFEDIEKYSQSLKELGIDLPVIHTSPKRHDVVQFDKLNCEQWHMPEKYYQINVLQWLLDRCQTDEEKLRVQMEYDLFEKKKLPSSVGLLPHSILGRSSLGREIGLTIMGGAAIK